MANKDYAIMIQEAIAKACKDALVNGTGIIAVISKDNKIIVEHIPKDKVILKENDDYTLSTSN